MTQLFLIFLIIAGSVAGLAIGALWGRQPPRSSCAASAACLVRCLGCPADDLPRDPEVGHDASAGAP